MVFIREGTITPLYSFNRTEVSTNLDNFHKATDLLNGNYTLDLHVFNDELGHSKSKGELLIDSEDNSQYCYITFEMINETIWFTDRSTEFGSAPSHH